MKKKQHDHFDFTPLYTLVGRDGEPLYPVALPLFEKCFSHAIWIALWLTLSLLFSPLFLLAVVHLFFFGCRLTQLLLIGGLKPIIFPPLWIRLTRQLQKGKGLELLQKYQLDTHPGLLVNLALTQWNRKEKSEARATLQKVREFCPDDPFLSSIEFRDESEQPKTPDRIEDDADQEESAKDDQLSWDPETRQGN